jgi:hypothetical protein
MQISDVMQEAASLLGDYARNIWTDVSIIDYVKSAHNQIQNELILNGMRPFQTLSAVVQVPKDTMELANLPTDFFLPIDIQERTPAGGGINDGNWIPMTEREFEPTAKPLSTLGYWAFRNNALKFAGSSADRELLLRYYSLSAGVVNDVNSVVNLNNAVSMYAALTAYLAASFKGRNEKAANRLERLWLQRRDTYLGIEALNKQGVTHRRRPYTTKKRFGAVI